MKFEEKFPELEPFNHTGCYGRCIICDNDEEHVTIKDIEKHCLSKQRVKEIIDKLTETEWNVEVTPEEYFVTKDNLLKELGIE